MKVRMIPHVDQFKDNPRTESGIRRVIEAYFRGLPEYGVELVDRNATTFDLRANHAGMEGAAVDVAHVHGMYWTADYPAEQWELKANRLVIDSIRHASQVTVPSSWVAETFQRDVRYTPSIIPHGIDWEQWQHDSETLNYVLWNKNRNQDVCNPEAVGVLSQVFPDVSFVTTFAPDEAGPNVREIGLQPHERMKKIVQQCAVYLATTKETFGIGILEAMASGVPVLGFAHGGITNLIQHGVNGYLAEPRNYDDLGAGLVYCYQHRSTLGANGRELARSFTWDRVCEQVAGVYREAMVVEPASVSVVITSYNYSHVVSRAIGSMLDQTFAPASIIVVDDGSPDGGETRKVVEAMAEHDNRIRYVRQKNQGVAAARNTGIAMTDSKYVCCLDADDAVEPEFLQACVDALEKDRSLGLAYTRLKLLLPNDRVYTKTKWPTEPNFDEQIQGRNQVPTCCVYRRDMWERLGGYRQRYAPHGCGSEDAEFWLRAGASGWGMALASPEAYFVYSFGAGGTTGNPDYQEIDWLEWHPWTRDLLHPFASIASPGNGQSHLVQQYDEPIISVVIPVGKGHESTVINVLDSLEAQTFRKWEAIVVWDTGDRGQAAFFEKSYPYVRWVWTSGSVGAGRARNMGADIARGELLLFADADDWELPECLEQMLLAYDEEGGDVGVYTDYIGLAYIDDVDQIDPKLKERIRYREGTWTVIGHKALDYDPDRVASQPDLESPYIWNTITTLHPRSWWKDVGGFDESMISLEDWDYWLRLARDGKRFVRIEDELFVYQYYSGRRRNVANPATSDGLQNAKSLVQYMQEKYEGVPIMPCAGCGGRRARPSIAPTVQAQMTAAAAPAAMNENDMIMARYTSGNKGDHRVIGPFGFESRIPGVKMINRGGRWYMDYGYRCGGAVFYVHRLDVQTSGMFVAEESLAGRSFMNTSGRGREQAAPRPVSMREMLQPADPNEQEQQSLIGPPVQVQDEGMPPPPMPIARTPVVQSVEGGDPLAELFMQGPGPLVEQAERIAADEVDQDAGPTVTPLDSVPGITPAIHEQMIGQGITNAQQLRDRVAGGLDLTAYSGIAQVRAEAIAAFLKEVPA